jgi:putative FmdB family regulatory protein
MPRYSMQCKTCGNEFERACRIDDRNDQRCPRCNETATVSVACLGSDIAGSLALKRHHLPVGMPCRPEGWQHRGIQPR